MSTVGRLLIAVILLLACCCNHVQAQIAGVRFPIDLYFLADNSGSIKPSWTKIVTFASTLQSRMATLAGGYYINDTAQGDGLRVSISLFGCDGLPSSPKPKTIIILKGPTGDQNAIRQGLQTMKGDIPKGGTCPSGALEKFRQEIVANRQNASARPTAVIVLTDGAIWPRDLSKVSTTSTGLRSLDQTYMFGINYGGGSSVQKEWSDLVGSSSRVFPGTDLDQVANLLSVIMLGQLTVQVTPTSDQLARVANFSQSQNTTVCLGENNVPVLLTSRAVTLFGASGLQCDFTRLEGNQTFTVQPVSIDGQVYCNIPGSLVRKVVAPDVFSQTFSLLVYAVKSGYQKTLIFTVPFISYDVVVCLYVQFVGASPVGNDNCFPPADATNTSVGLLSFSGPTMSLPGATFDCAFDGTTKIPAVPQGNSMTCPVPGVDVASALAQGTDPTPFHQFQIQTSTGGVLLDSNVDSTSFTPVSCIDTAASSRNTGYCWNASDTSANRALFEGESLSNLINNYANLEFTCEYGFAGMAQVFDVPATLLAGSNQVQCNPPPLQNLLGNAYSASTVTRSLSASIRVRSSIGSSSRGWWTMKVDNTFPVTVSPCLDVSIPTSTLCLGDTYPVAFSNSGVANFVQFGKQNKCYFLNSKGQTLVSESVTLTSSSQASCAWPSATGALAFVQLRNNDIVLTNSSVESSVGPCFTLTRSIQGSSASFCWGTALSEESITITGPSVAFYASSQAVPTCKFSLDGKTSTVVRTPAKRTSNNDGFICSYPQAWGFLDVPFTANASFALEDTTQSYSLPDPLGPVSLLIQSCVAPIKSQLNPIDVGQSLPDCAPDCCLQNDLEVDFSGQGADTITVCDWLASNGSILATTPANVTTAFTKCVLYDWKPLDPASALPVAKVLVYSDLNRTTLLGQDSLSTRQYCVYSAFDSGIQVTYGTALELSFNGPTIRALAGLFTVQCGLTLPGESGLARLVTAETNAKGGLTCTLNNMYDSLTGASLMVFLLSSEATTPSPTSFPTPARTITLVPSPQTAAKGRRLRSLQQQVPNGITLYSTSLSNVQVSSGMAAAVSPSSCVAQTNPTMSLVLSGPGAIPLQHAVMCGFTASNSATGTTPVVLDLSTNSLVCSFSVNSTLTPQDSISYNATIVRPDTNATLLIASGSQMVCASNTPVGPPTLFGQTASPTQSGSGGLAAGAIVGIVVALLALVLFLVVGIWMDKKRRDDKKRKREFAEETSASAAAQAAVKREREEEMKKRENVDEVPPELIDPSSAEKMSDDSQNASVADISSQHPGPRGPSWEDGEDLVVVAVDTAHQRKFKVGDCVQFLDTSDDTWRFTFVRNLAPQPMEYLLEDERTPISESRIRWPNYAAGESVEMRRENEWTPAVVAYCDPEHGLVGLMGHDHDVPCGDIRPAPFKIGENVEERGPDGEWRPAVVVGCEPDGTFLVDGAGGLGLNRTRKRLRWPQYHGGDIVEVRKSDPDGRQGWKRATVVTMEGSIVVGLEDGTVEPRRFQNCDVRRPLAVKTSSPVVVEEPSLLAGDEESSPRRKFKRREPLDFTELPDFCFEITVDKKHGLGVRFGWTRDQLIVVQKFLSLPGLDAGPLEASEKVSLGDQLLGVNSVSIGGKSFAEVTDIIRQSPEVITLKFGRWRETVKLKGVPLPSFGSGKKPDQPGGDLSMV